MSLNTVSVKNLGGWPAQIVARHREVIVSTMQLSVATRAPSLIQAAISSYPRQPVHTGDFKRSWKVAKERDGVVIYNPTIQAGIIERGRRPGFGVSRQGIEDLARWAHLHGMDRAPVSKRERGIRRNMRKAGVGSKALSLRSSWQRDNRALSAAWAIAISIKRRGIKARPILGPVTPLLRRLVVEDVNRAVYGGTR